MQDFNMILVIRIFATFLWVFLSYCKNQYHTSTSSWILFCWEEHWLCLPKSVGLKGFLYLKLAFNIVLKCLKVFLVNNWWWWWKQKMGLSWISTSNKIVLFITLDMWKIRTKSNLKFDLGNAKIWRNLLKGLMDTFV